MRQDRAYRPVNTLIPGARGHRSAPNDILRQTQQKTDPEAYPPALAIPSHQPLNGADAAGRRRGKPENQNNKQALYLKLLRLKKSCQLKS
jgi:hypothetical protein